MQQSRLQHNKQKRLTRFDIRFDTNSKEVNDDNFIIAIDRTGIKITNRSRRMIEKWVASKNQLE